MIYDNLTKNLNNKTEIPNKVIIHFVRGAFVEVKGNKVADYTIEFINKSNGNLLYKTTIKNNCWAKCSVEYFIDYHIKIYENGELWREHHYNAENHRVYIALDSKALGDTMAWFPYVDEFRKKHKCKMVVSTFMNNMFEENYPDIEFIKPGEGADNLYAMYTIGLYYNEDSSINFYKNPTSFFEEPLQKMASDILGLPYVEVRPKLKKNKIEINSEYKQVCIGVFGTAQSKFWNNPTGWQRVVNWLIGRGYVVKLLSKENDGYMGNRLPKGIVKHPEGPLDLVVDELQKSKAFIGIGSGLSWLSWAVGTPVVLISGFSYNWAEMQDCIRIGAPEGKCTGCFNRYRLDAGDWNWCPDHKGTDKMFECTKSITPEMVISELEKIL